MISSNGPASRWWPLWGFACVVALAGCGASSQGGLSGTINIGFIGPLTGNFIQAGASLSEGAELAANIINLNGGVLGHKFQIDEADDGGDPVDAVTALRKMLALDNVSAVTGLTGLDYQDTLPILNSSHMVSMTHIGDPAIDHLIMPYSYSTGPSDALVGTSMAYYASTQGYKRIALVFDALQSSQTLVPSVVHAAQVLGLQVVVNEALANGAPSYSSQVQQVLAAHPDAILSQLNPPNAGPFFQEFQNAGGATIPIVGSDITAEAAWQSAVGPVIAKDTVSMQPAAFGNAPSVPYFMTNFERLYHTTPQFLSSLFYDGVNVSALAMIEANSSDPTVYYKDVVDVTTSGSGHTDVYNFAQGAKLLKAGKKIKYVGVGSPMTFNMYHRVTTDFDAVRDNGSGGTTPVTTIPADKLLPLL
jgi:branched-chain amino acid transport system substrate-binding protein